MVVVIGTLIMILYETDLYQLVVLSPICEQKSLLPDNNLRPGDSFLPVWNAGQPAALEITVTSLLQSSLNINASEKNFFRTVSCWGEEVRRVRPEM